MLGQNSLNTFYQSVKFSNPSLAEEIRDDVMIVALNALLSDKSAGEEAADRLRRAAWDMPVIHARVLENALVDLGY